MASSPPPQRKGPAKAKKAAPKGAAGPRRAPSKTRASGRKASSTARSPYLVVAFSAALLAVFWLLFCLWSWLAPLPAPKRDTVARAPRVEKKTDPLQAERAANATIMRALVDMRGLPFEESLSAPLEDGVKQADYALLQAMLRLGIKPEAVSLDKVELRHKGAEAYHFQILRLRFGPDPLPFAAALHEALRAWADKAELRQGQGALWTISVLGTPTHELHMERARPDAAPPEQAAPQLPTRRPGEAARMVIVMDDLGQNMAATRSLLALPYPVTFAVWPSGSHARETAVAAHNAGREVIVHQPMEPLGYPKVKPGPNPLLVGANQEHIERTLSSSLAHVPHAVGLNNHMGSRFTTQDAAGVRAVVQGLKSRHLFALDSFTHPASRFYGEAKRQGLPALRRDVFLDVSAKRADILVQLQKAEKIAMLTGRSVAIGHPLPETLAALREWAHVRNRQIELVTLNALINGK